MASSNLYVYGGNNPIKNIDSNGQFIETAADVVSLGASIYDFSTDPSLTYGLFLAWDIVGLLPGVPGSWAAKVVKKGAGYGDELIQGDKSLGKKSILKHGMIFRKILKDNFHQEAKRVSLCLGIKELII